MTKGNGYQCKKLLMRYYMAGRSKFYKPLIVSFSSDAGKTGNKERLIGCVALPDGLAHWCTPQVDWLVRHEGP